MANNGVIIGPSRFQSVSSRDSVAPPGVDQAQWDANPYASFDYNHSRWQALLESIGFRSKFDEYRDSLALNAREYDSQLLEKAHNEAYDSAQAQVARERAAGINPDIAGDVSAGGSSVMEPDPNAPISPGHDDLSQISGFAGMVMDAFNMASGLASTGFSFASGIASLRGQKMANDDKRLDVALKALLSVVNPTDLSNYDEIKDNQVPVISYFDSLSQVFGSKRAKKYISTVNKLAGGLTFRQLETRMRHDFASDWAELHDIISGDNFSWFSDTLKDLRHTLSDDLFRSLAFHAKNSADYEEARQNVNEEGQNMPQVQALNESQGQTYDVQNKRSDYALKERNLALRNTFEDLVKKMNDKADRGNFFAGLFSIALSLLGSRFFGM